MFCCNSIASDNVTDWAMSWGGQFFFSHGTNLSAGVRVQVVQVTISNAPFVFINVYTHNSTIERIRLFGKINSTFKKIKQFLSSSVGRGLKLYHSTSH